MPYIFNIRARVAPRSELNLQENVLKEYHYKTMRSFENNRHKISVMLGRAYILDM